MVPGDDSLLPLLTRQFVLVHHPLWQYPVITGQGLVNVSTLVTILGLHCIRGQQDGCLWWAVDFVAEDGILHLQVEQAL